MADWFCVSWNVLFRHVSSFVLGCFSRIFIFVFYFFSAILYRYIIYCVITSYFPRIRFNLHLRDGGPGERFLPADDERKKGQPTCQQITVALKSAGKKNKPYTQYTPPLQFKRARGQALPASTSWFFNNKRDFFSSSFSKYKPAFPRPEENIRWELSESNWPIISADRL